MAFNIGGYPDTSLEDTARRKVRERNPGGIPWAPPADPSNSILGGVRDQALQQFGLSSPETFYSEGAGLQYPSGMGRAELMKTLDRGVDMVNRPPAPAASTSSPAATSPAAPSATPTPAASRPALGTGISAFGIPSVTPGGLGKTAREAGRKIYDAVTAADVSVATGQPTAPQKQPSSAENIVYSDGKWRMQPTTVEAPAGQGGLAAQALADSGVPAGRAMQSVSETPNALAGVVSGAPTTPAEGTSTRANALAGVVNTPQGQVRDFMERTKGMSPSERLAAFRDFRAQTGMDPRTFAGLRKEAESAMLREKMDARAKNLLPGQVALENGRTITMRNTYSPVVDPNTGKVTAAPTFDRLARERDMRRAVDGDPNMSDEERAAQRVGLGDMYRENPSAFKSYVPRKKDSSTLSFFGISPEEANRRVGSLQAQRAMSLPKGHPDRKRWEKAFAAREAEQRRAERREARGLAARTAVEQTKQLALMKGAGSRETEAQAQSRYSQAFKDQMEGLAKAVEAGMNEDEAAAFIKELMAGLQKRNAPAKS